MRIQAFRMFPRALAVAAILSVAVHAQEPRPGKLKMKVEPIEAYTFVDGNAMGPGDRDIKLSPGNHNVIVANYGYKFFQQDVSINSKETTPLNVKLDPAGAEVSGPRGRIQVEVGGMTAGDAAVLLNGKTTGYFVGHVDEFNHNIWWKQELIVPPATHQLTVTRNGKELWSGMIPVAANHRVIVTISNGKQRDTDWPRGTELPEKVARFGAGAASATIDIAPVSSSVSANPGRINCSQPSQLAWNSAETVDAQMSGMSPVPTSGVRTVSPKQTTNYELTAVGPGGTTKSGATLEVNPVVDASLSASPMEVHYRRIGEKVIQQDGTTLNWSTSNAETTALPPVGSVSTNGSQTVKPAPTQTTDGPVDENISYTLTARNTCGGSATKVVAVHLVGSIEPIPGVPLQSIFYPTAYPDERDPTVGLVASERQTLTALAAGFTKYLEYDPDAKLSIVAHADPRGGPKYNEALAGRRADSVRQFLVAQGISADKIDASSVGAEKLLDPQTITELESQNPNPLPQDRAARPQTTQLAYQRRVDIVMNPTNAESTKFYPNNSPDSQVLWQRPKPPLSEVQGDK